MRVLKNEPGRRPDTKAKAFAMARMLPIRLLRGLICKNARVLAG